jgi:hypothetical protein
LADQGESRESGYFQNRRPEINVTFRYIPKVRRTWGISQVIIDLILGWFLETTQM